MVTIDGVSTFGGVNFTWGGVQAVWKLIFLLIQAAISKKRVWGRRKSLFGRRDLQKLPAQSPCAAPI